MCMTSISDVASLLVGSCDDSVVRVYSLTDKKLHSMKLVSQLSIILSDAAQSLYTTC